MRNAISYFLFYLSLLASVKLNLICSKIFMLFFNLHPFICLFINIILFLNTLTPEKHHSMTSIFTAKTVMANFSVRVVLALPLEAQR